MRTPYIVTIIVEKNDVEVANKALSDLGFGDENFNIDAETHAVFCSPLQEWEKTRIIEALDATGVAYKYSEDANDGKVKEKLENNVQKEGLQVKKLDAVIE